MKKRTNKFIGSDSWRGRDVSIYQPSPGALTVKDTITGITITGWIGQTDTELLADLAHRVRQLER